MNNASLYGNTPYYPSYPTPTYMPPTSTYQPNVQPSLINGRSVDTLEEITAGEVPLNGSLAVFPKRDGSVVYVKSMNGNGTIDTRYYIPAPEGYVDHPGSSTVETPTISNQDIMATILNIQDQLGDIQQLVKGRSGGRNKGYSKNGSQEKVENNA